MTGVLRSFRRPRSRLLLVAALLALTAQLVATLLAPVAEAQASHSAPAHVEANGTRQHHSHNPTDCAACVALQLTPVPQRQAAGMDTRVVRSRALPIARRRADRPEWFLPKNPRAPPAIPTRGR
jgi:hypothetical protein